MDASTRQPPSRKNRLAARAFKLVSTLSAILAIASAVAFIVRPPPLYFKESASVHGPRGRYGIRIYHDLILILGPTRSLPAPAGVDRNELITTVAQMRNEDIHWIDPGYFIQARGIDLVKVSENANVVRRELVDALDDPHRFAVAHLMLRCCSTDFKKYDMQMGEGFFDGLEKPTVVGTTEFYDPAQIPQLRDMWMDVLRQPILVVGYGTALVRHSILPAIWMMLAVIRRLKLRHRPPGFCPVCNYDLRATPHRCPECGNTDFHLA